MQKSKTFSIISLLIFILAEIVFSYFIQTTSGTTYIVLSLSSIALALVAVCVFHKSSLSWNLTFIALICTVIADFFLCGLIDFENIRTVAMLFFSITQICYFLRLYFNHEYTSEKRAHITVRTFLIVTVQIIVAIVLKENVNALALISMFYFTNLILNVIYSFIQIKIAPLFAIGLLLFSFCDVFVGLGVLNEFINVPVTSIINKINDVDLNLAWIFYVPSQTLIATDIIVNKKD